MFYDPHGRLLIIVRRQNEEVYIKYVDNLDIKRTLKRVQEVLDVVNLRTFKYWTYENGRYFQKNLDISLLSHIGSLNARITTGLDMIRRSDFYDGRVAKNEEEKKEFSSFVSQTVVIDLDNNEVSSNAWEYYCPEDLEDRGLMGEQFDDTDSDPSIIEFKRCSFREAADKLLNKLRGNMGLLWNGTYYIPLYD